MKATSFAAPPKQSQRNESQKAKSAPERRKLPRSPFTAGALVLEPESGARIDAHTSDLSVGGCYVDTMSALPSGTEVELRLAKDGKTFRTKARVAHYNMGIGMGLLFTSMPPEQLSLLEKWFGEVHGDSKPPQFKLETDAEAEYGDHLKFSERYVLEEMLLLMMRKGLFTEEEGQTILKKLTG